MADSVVTKLRPFRPFRPLKPRARTFRRAARDIAALVSFEPSSRAAEPVRIELEHLLMGILMGGGLRALDQVVRAARRHGVHLQPTASAARYRAWEGDLPERDGFLLVSSYAWRDMRTMLVSWRARPKPLVFTPAARRVHDEQEAFYARYMAAGDRAYASPPRRISAVDRSILLIGELEADVNNGGFAQYLDNKGRRRAGEALKALRRVGAKATARLLQAALDPALSEAERSRLDDRFYERREDLARLAFRTFKLRRAEASK
jgi:hypothetical protein